MKLNFLDYLFVLRPTLIFPIWTVLLANYRLDIYSNQNHLLAIERENPTILFILVGFLMGSVYIINQIKDIITDQQNEKLFIIANGHISKKNAIIEAFVLAFISIAYAFYINWLVGVIFIGIFLVIGIFYNLKPFVWKDKPVLGIVAHIWGSITVASLGRICAGAQSWRFLLYTPAYAFAVVSIYILTTLADMDGDTLIGKNTFGVKYGVKKSTYLALFLEFITIVLTFLMRDFIFFIPAVMAFPLFLMAAITQKIENVENAIKFTLLFASIAVCVKFPIYFLGIIFTYFFSKWYYRKRFNVEYPKLSA